MEIMDGTLGNLLRKRGRRSCVAIANIVLPHMLQALAFLESKNILHRDVKPENILYRETGPERYEFVLADFGFAKRRHEAETICGTPLFAAPEMRNAGGTKIKQTHKLDSYSLYATMMWVLNVDRFREASATQQYALLSKPPNDSNMMKIWPMGRLTVRERVTASEMLRTLYKGVTDQTPDEQIPAVFSDHSLSVSALFSQLRITTKAGAGAPRTGPRAGGAPRLCWYPLVRYRVPMGLDCMAFLRVVADCHLGKPSFFVVLVHLHPASTPGCALRYCAGMQRLRESLPRSQHPRRRQRGDSNGVMVTG